jgi:phosphate starvation-inducible PhoH-like protein
MLQSLNQGSDMSKTQGLLTDTILTSERGKPIGPRTAGQKVYLDALRTNDLVFCIGPAGTGKTYLAVAQAVAALKAKEVTRIVLTRPAVEAGENLGFLPGDLEAKVDPYLRPLFDALYDMLDTEKAQKLIERRIVEVAPLAYMRGRTLNDSFVILDEAQNTTPMQMKMFLTRLGFGSRMVVTGDVTQTDLPAGQESGLRVASRILGSVKGIAFTHLTKADIVRHSIVQRIIEAYEKSEGTSHG